MRSKINEKQAGSFNRKITDSDL
jgi:hypothetical protein